MTAGEHCIAAETHVVFNQPPALENYNLYAQDVALKEALHREGGGWAEAQVHAYGGLAGSEGMIAQGFQANENPPVFHSHDRFGQRIDRVDYHPAYHQLMATAIDNSLHSLPWTTPVPGAQVARAALEYLHTQVDAGTCCPLTMTFACIPSLRKQPSVAAVWEPLITASHYDPRNVPATQKSGVTIGMAMTEKQGGTDVRANTTRARPVAGSGAGAAYELIGHKWFCSAPMADAFLTLAQAPGGLSCFLLPRWRPDGSRNAFYIQRLKPKLGNHSNASSEVEFRGAYAVMIGAEGRGVATIIDMVSLTRFDCLVGSAALMRQAVAQACHHIAYRTVFGKPLIDQPLMQNVAADLAIESEAALVLAMRVARALDEAGRNESAKHLARIATAVGKYWVCKRAPTLINEAQECLGGAGYVEESILPRLYREAPVNSIWEGSGNVQCLDVLRALARNPETLQAYLDEVKEAQGADRCLDGFVRKLEQEWHVGEDKEYRARHVVESLALALQASLLVRFAPPAVADAFCASRLQERGGYGTLPSKLECKTIIERARPRLA